jgi:hypothetical protein
MIEATINIQTTQIRRSIRSQVRKDFSPVYRFPRAHPTEAERAAEKGHFWGRISPRVAGAKAPFSHFKQLMARLKPPQRRRPVAGDPGKSCPFAHLLPSWSFSAACEAQFFLASCGPAEAVPFYKSRPKPCSFTNRVQSRALQIRRWGCPYPRPGRRWLMSMGSGLS